MVELLRSLAPFLAHSYRILLGFFGPEGFGLEDKSVDESLTSLLVASVDWSWHRLLGDFLRFSIRSF